MADRTRGAASTRLPPPRRSRFAVGPGVRSCPMFRLRSPRASPRPSGCRASRASSACADGVRRSFAPLRAAAAPRRTPPSSRFCTAPSGSCDDAVHSPCTASGPSGSAGRLYTCPPAVAITPTAIFAPTSLSLPWAQRHPLHGGGVSAEHPPSLGAINSPVSFFLDLSTMETAMGPG